MELPFIDALRVDQSKITGYLLDDAAGRGKATFFLRLGFRPENREPRPRVRTVWILETGTEAPRLITAHPA